MKSQKDLDALFEGQLSEEEIIARLKRDFGLSDELAWMELGSRLGLPLDDFGPPPEIETPRPNVRAV